VQEFTADELVQAIAEIPSVKDMKWIHFEGRIPETLTAAVPKIRSIIPGAFFSLEIEKPDRHQLLDLIPFIDVVFFSHTFYVHSGYDTPSAFFSAMRQRTQTGEFVLTAGADGAYCSRPEEFHIPTTQVGVVDAIGAGDTFIAGYIWSAIHLGQAPLERMKSAVALATKKVAQDGFSNLWSSASDL
jgi:ketohexokinase